MAEPTVRFQPTPNPNAGKFSTDRTVVQNGSRSYFSAEQAAGDPVAGALFAIPGVASVFMVADFITVTKTPDARWEELVPRVEQAIRATLR
ncbi:MAG TPA: NifU N-terminal domain-containing protein [Longimicrobiales bacterium]